MQERRHSSVLAMELHLSCIILYTIDFDGEMDIPSNLYYKTHQIPKLKCFSSCLVVVFVQSIETMC